jgi:hypothetical protein
VREEERRIRGKTGDRVSLLKGRAPRFLSRTCFSQTKTALKLILVGYFAFIDLHSIEGRLILLTRQKSSRP